MRDYGGLGQDYDRGIGSEWTERPRVGRKISVHWEHGIMWNKFYLYLGIETEKVSNDLGIQVLYSQGKFWVVCGPSAWNCLIDIYNMFLTLFGVLLHWQFTLPLFLASSALLTLGHCTIWFLLTFLCFVPVFFVESSFLSLNISQESIMCKV